MAGAGKRGLTQIAVREPRPGRRQGIKAAAAAPAPQNPFPGTEPDRRNKKKLRATGRHAPHLTSRPRLRTYARPIGPTATRGTATTSHAAPARRPGQAALTPVVGRSGATGACEVGEGWSVTGQPAQEKGMGEIREGWEEQGKANPTRLGHVFKRPPSVAPAAAESSDGERTADR